MLDAQYFGGYTVECSLKALILYQTPDPDKQDKLKQITSGKKMHRPDVLLGELRDLGVSLPLEIAKRMRRFDWTTDLRHQRDASIRVRDDRLSENRKRSLRLGGGPTAVTNSSASCWASQVHRGDSPRRGGPSAGGA